MGKKEERAAKITIKRKFRDEVCTACKHTFRAGWAAEGYTHLFFVGYHSVINRNSILCHKCTQFVLKLIGEPTLDILLTCPQALYTWNKGTDNLNERPTKMTMGLNKKEGNSLRYNKKKLKKAVDLYSKKMKRKEPWSNVNYYEVAGLRI